MTPPWNRRTLSEQNERGQFASASLLQPTRAIPGLRWWILGLIFLVTCINYIDRSSIGLLVTHFGPEIGISGSQYGLIGALLLLAYTVSQSISGRLYDRYGARLASRSPSLSGVRLRLLTRPSRALPALPPVPSFSV